MEKYLVYVDDGENVFKVAVVAEDLKGAYRQVEGAGEVVCCRAIHDDYPVSEDYLLDVLEDSHFGKIEKQLIMSVLRQSGILC